MNSRPALLLAGLALFCASARAATEAAQGAALFRGNCAFCHGLNGSGGRGPDLRTARITPGTSDEDLRRIVNNGIPGTGMPGFGFEKDELDGLIAHVRTLGASAAPAEPVRGDPVRGETVYEKSGCSGCHRIGERGSVFGPALTRVGSARTPGYLLQSIANPSSDIAIGYEGVRVVTRDGKRIEGVRINEDTFTIQLRLRDESFVMLKKADVRSIDALKDSLMPAYRIAPKDLDDLVAYLASLRGAVSTSHVQHTETIH